MSQVALPTNPTNHRCVHTGAAAQALAVDRRGQGSDHVNLPAGGEGDVLAKEKGLPGEDHGQAATQLRYTNQPTNQQQNNDNGL